MLAEHLDSIPPQVSPPEFALSALAPHALSGISVIALPVISGDSGAGASGAGEISLRPEADAFATAAGVDFFAVLEAAGATGKAGEVTTVPVAHDGALLTVHLVGIGEGQPADLRRAGAALARATKNSAAVATSVASGVPGGGLSAFVVGMMLGSFGFHWRSSGPKDQPVAHVVLAGLSDADEHAPELLRAIATGGASWFARMLSTVPSNVKNPAWLAQQAREAAERAGLPCTVWGVPELERAGMGGLLAVGQASASPPCLIRIDYAPARASRRTPTVVLVGKGITFDTGGLSIKPGESMTTMKRDMTGAAVVLAVLGALAEIRCPVRVIGLMAVAENSIAGNAMRPGDVIRHYGGRTSEVTNTDAEGRLVLADALAYAVAELSPTVVVDVATLTGAMKVALGQRVGGFFANHDGLAASISSAGERSGEPLWRFPLVADYEDKLASKVADANNAAGGAGAITAALFLQHFVGSVPWAHLDVASVGDSPTESFEWTEGPTGFGARALLTWLGDDFPLEALT